MKPFYVLYAFWVVVFLSIFAYLKILPGLPWLLSGVLGLLVLIRSASSVIREKGEGDDPLLGAMVIIALFLTAWGPLMLVGSLITTFVIRRAFKRFSLSTRT